jgi:hypothetical protein
VHLVIVPGLHDHPTAAALEMSEWTYHITAKNNYMKLHRITSQQITPKYGRTCPNSLDHAGSTRKNQPHCITSQQITLAYGQYDQVRSITPDQFAYRSPTLTIVSL